MPSARRSRPEARARPFWRGAQERKWCLYLLVAEQRTDVRGDVAQLAGRRLRQKFAHGGGIAAGHGCAARAPAQFEGILIEF